MSQDTDELGSQVTELKATVRGLTEELVEQNERIKELEAELGMDEEIGGADAPPEDAADDEATTPAEEGDGGPSEFDDIIVA